MKMLKLKLSNYINIIHVETKKLYILSSLGSIKLSNNLNILNELKKNILWLRNKWLSKNLKSLLIVYVNLVTKLLIENLYGSLGKLKIVGLGYKLLYSDNQFIFKLGYSHLIYNQLSLNYYTKKKKKKKKYISIGSIKKENISSLLKKIQLFRIPDKYSCNGIYSRLDNIQFIKQKKTLF